MQDVPTYFLHIRKRRQYIRDSTPTGAITSTPSITSSKIESQVPSASAPGSPKVYSNAVYFTNWFMGIYKASYTPQNLPVSDLTHVPYAFADIGSDGTVKTSDPWGRHGQAPRRYGLLDRYRPQRVRLCRGALPSQEEKPPSQNLALHRRLVLLVQVRPRGGHGCRASDFRPHGGCSDVDYGFDGLDVDWEYPIDAQEAQDFVLLLQTCREQLDQYASQNQLDYRFLMTVASPAGPANYAKMDLKGMDEYVDAWNLMTYDYAGAWDATTGHQSNLFNNAADPVSTKFNTDDAVQYYLDQGIAASKIILGLPLYGRSFEATAGFGLPYTGTGGGGGQEGSPEAGVWLYKYLPRAGATESWDDVVKAAWSFDAQSGGSGELVTYDNVQSAGAKADYVKSRGLGGAFFWDASGDQTGEGSLIATTSGDFGSLDLTSNNLMYPTSQYDNIRNGMSGS